MNLIGVIPARMDSSRFPGKPLKMINNKTMLEWVVEGSRSKLLDRVVVATPDLEIYDKMCELNIESVMTNMSHERASDRTQEAVEIIEKRENVKFDIVVMIQGDEPMIKPHMINQALAPIISGEYRISNLMQVIDNEDWKDPGEVKVVVNDLSEAVYFSREPIPSEKKYSAKFEKFKQVCIIPFERQLLDEYSMMKPTWLELIESIDMLRLIENKIPIKMILTDDITYSVDTINDLLRVQDIII